MVEQKVAWIGAVAALLSAVAWWWACQAEVLQPVTEEERRAAEAVGQWPEDGKIIDPFATADEQNRRNKWAAFCTGIAAVMQAILLTMQHG